MTIIGQKFTTVSQGLDLLRDSVHRLAGYNRTLQGLGLSLAATDAGAAASFGAGGLQVDFYVGDVLVANMFNFNSVFHGATDNGAADRGQAPVGLDLVPVGAAVPAGAEIRAIVNGSPTLTNITAILIMEIYAAPDTGFNMSAMGY